MKFLVILLLIFGGIYLLFKYFTRKVIKTFMNNMGMNQEAFKNQTQQNSFNNQNGEVLYQKGETVVLKGEAGKEKK
jgi:hypothetical protein